MKFIDQIAQYLYLKKTRASDADPDIIRYMHGINRVSLFLFIMSLLIIFTRALIRCL
ncbi:MAG TPA: DUF6728 family protein [Puia sp.]|nr:DUF6728 family protein [Puia sp.]